MAQEITDYSPGARVRVFQQIPRAASGSLQTSVEGVIVEYGQAKTGSWFAHTKDGRVWLDRLTLKKDDGEMVVCNLDQYSRVELVESAPAGD